MDETVTPRFAIGLGCRRGCSAASIVLVIRDACATLDLGRAGLFSIAAKRHEPGLHDAAATLRLPLTFLEAEDLAAMGDHVTHRSPRVLAVTGVPSVAEAAALAGAGPGGRLVVRRLAHAAATCAVAAASEESP